MRTLSAGFAILALLLAGCGGSDSSNGDPTSTQQSTGTTAGAGADSASAAGKPIFTSNCGGCHTLADAGTNGQVGPNLDDLKPDNARVKRQVENGGGQMPSFKGRLSPQEIDQVATYVSSVAGKS